MGGHAMKNSTFALETFVPALRTLSGLLDKGAEHARAKGADPAGLLKERLASDMFPLASQVQLVCHHAKEGTARATGAEPPKLEIKEMTFEEHKALVDNTIKALTAIGMDAFAGAENSKIELPLQGSRVFEANGLQFVQHWSIPHFYFHLVTAYDILRHVGVQLGKRDYMIGITQGYIRQGAPA
jgi:hypothetical protein